MVIPSQDLYSLIEKNERSDAMRPSWKPSKQALDNIRKELGDECADLFHRKYRIAKERCCNPNNKDYEHYKGKFAFKSFVDFYNCCYDDFKKSYLKYGNNLSIDRIDSAKGYENGNVRFVPMEINLKNKPNVVPVIVIDTLTNEHSLYDTFGEACKALKVVEQCGPHIKKANYIEKDI
jgi:hypothetical protein